jgi:hypothetical protein
MKLAKKITTVLCDDIRKETGNKVSLMGVYSKDIILPAVPAILPKLCLFVMLEGVEREIPSLNVKIILPASDPVELTMTTPAGQKVPQNMNMGIEISPFRINKVGEARIEIRFPNERKPIITHKFMLRKTD